ncbi:MAG: aminopeptidase N [Planctomycetota bacterium]|nr:MAG: aminopeptidase N [Planctomycetota bacterium]
MSTTTAAAPAAIRLADYRPPAWRASTVELCFDLHDAHTDVDATVVYELAQERGAEFPELVLDGEELQLLSVLIDGAEPEHAPRFEGERLVLQPTSERFTLAIRTRIDPANNTALSGLYRSGSVYCTQMEAEGFRRVTYFQDRPDVLATYTTTVRADRTRYPVLLANGNLVQARALADNRHEAVWHDPHPKPCYLFALVAGDLEVVDDEFVTRSGREVTLKLFVDPGNTGRAPHAMESLKRAMRWDEQRFGREYDLDIFMIVAVSDFNMGAMENKGLNIFNAAAVLCDDASSTDDDFTRIEAIVGHEYFHNWSGNRVTCRDWFQLSLKEGFTVYRDQEFTADLHSRAVARIIDVRQLRSMQFPEDAGPMAHPVRPTQYLAIDNFYTTTIYEKGAELIRMMATLLGRDGFRKGCDLYFERHDGQAATTEDFARALTDATGKDLTGLRGWYEQAGTPVLTALTRWDAATNSLELTLNQRTPPTPGQPDKQPVTIPVRMALFGRDGRALPLQLADESTAGDSERVLELASATQSWRFVGLPSEPLPSLLRDFSAPVHLEQPLSDEQLAFLARHDDDLFNRWEAVQRLATNSLLALVDDARAGETLQLPTLLRDTLDTLLDDRALDPAFAAVALQLPEVVELAERMQPFEPELLEAAYTAVSRGYAQHAGERLAARRAELRAHPGAGAEAAGRRALANICLSWWMSSGDRAAIEACAEQYHAAEQMTDAQAALEELCHLDTPQRDAALAHFLKRWRNDKLVLNKWFAAQAKSLRGDTLERVEALAEHPAFDTGNPNHLRALYRNLGRNLLRFHHRSGSGYALLARVLLQVDARNPVLAGRLGTLFLGWRRLDSARQDLVRGELRALLDGPKLSTNLFEVLSQALG